MKRITSSLLALLLALSMLIGMVPAAYAAPADTIESIGSTETADSSETEAVSDEAEEVAVYAATNEAMIGDQAYATLQDAIDAASTGDTITLLKDGTLGSNITKGVTIVGQEVDGVKPVISANYWYKADNLTLKNVKLVRSDRLGIQDASNVAFVNCEITRASATSEFALVDVKPTAKNVTFTDCVFDSLGQASVIYASGKNVTLTNCQLKNADYGVYCDGFSGNMTVNNCEFTNVPYNVARKENDSAVAEYSFTGCKLAGYFGFMANEKAEFKNCAFTKSSKYDGSYNTDWNIIITSTDISFDSCSFTEDLVGKFYVSVNASPTTIIALNKCKVVDANDNVSSTYTLADLASNNMTNDASNVAGILAIDAEIKDGKVVSGKLVGDASNINSAVAEGSTYNPEEGTVTSGSSSTETSIDLDTFLTKLAGSGYNFDGMTDGKKLQVKWSPVSGCFDNRGAAGHNCTVNNVAATGNTYSAV